MIAPKMKTPASEKANILSFLSTPNHSRISTNPNPKSADKKAFLLMAHIHVIIPTLVQKEKVKNRLIKI